MEATQNSTPELEAPALLSEAWRAKAAGSAGAEISAIAALMQRDHDTIDPDLLRGFAIRLEHLSSVVMSAAWDERAAEAEISELLLGPETARMRVRAAQAQAQP